jgi:pilus assembly protein CpaC
MQRHSHRHSKASGGTRRAARIALAAALTALAAAPAARATIPVSLGHESILQVSRPSGEAEQVRALDLEMGKSTFLRTDFTVRRVSVGNPGVLEVNVLSPREIQLVPVQPGDTNVVLWDQSGIPVLVMDASVGSAFSPIARRIGSVLGVDDVRVQAAGEAVVLTGSVPSPVHAERAVAIAKAYFPEDADQRVVNALEVGGNQQVMIEVVIAEMQRSLGRDLTVNWSTIFKIGSSFYSFDSFLGGLASFDNRGTDFETGSILKQLIFSDGLDATGTILKPGDYLVDIFLDISQSKGLAKVLARPTLLARSGQTASFLAGGEIPIPVAQGGAFGSITIEYKQFGVGVEFAPTVLGADRIHLEVSPEVSQPDFTIGTVSQGILTPGFTTRRSSTSVELGDGQTFAIAGLLSDQVNEFAEKYPLLGDIPILGALFRSTSFQRKETELVILVTPRLVKPLPPGRPRLPTDSFAEPNDFEFFLLGALESQRSPEATYEDEGGGLIGPAGHRLSGEIEEGTP